MQAIFEKHFYSWIRLAPEVALLNDKSRHPAVIEVKKSHDQVLNELLNSFEYLEK
jgi:hypothetical protein